MKPLAASKPILKADFRKDINGLRAWAVIAVIFYHFKVPGFTGGFIGVDVFFVISGFLMTGIVYRGLEQSRFSTVDFYLARARRIVPALLALVITLLVLGWFFLLPPDFKTLGTHAISSLGFFSNIKFWDEAGYFDVASHEKWLLHTWSLSVEWQFYLLLPLLMSAAWRIRPGLKPQIWLLTCILLISFATSIFTTTTSPTAAFFLLHTRAWEMLIGGLIFLLDQRIKCSKQQRVWLERIGLGLILISINIFDSSSQWPGWNAAMPVMAAAFVLAANRSSPWTGNKTMQWMGDRSYSLYLWHWPVSVALFYMELQTDNIAIVVGIFATLICGHFSYLWVEGPARKALATQRRNVAVYSLTASLLATGMLALVVRIWDGVPGRFSEAVELAASEAANTNPRTKECHMHSGTTSPSCVVGGKKIIAVYLGDSHVPATISALAGANTNGDTGVAWWSYSGCPYVPSMKLNDETAAKLGKNYRCSEFNDWASKRLMELPSDIPVVLIGRYAKLAFGDNVLGAKTGRPSVYFSKEAKVATSDFIEEFGLHITNDACQLAKQRTVYMVRPIPEIGLDVPKTLSRRMAMGLKNDISLSIADYQARNSWVWAAQDAAREKCGIKLIDPTKYLCDQQICFGSKNGRPLYFDDNHLSEFGNLLLMLEYGKFLSSVK